jgi:hypothetical protein
VLNSTFKKEFSFHFAAGFDLEQFLKYEDKIRDLKQKIFFFTLLSIKILRNLFLFHIILKLSKKITFVLKCTYE